ncbi:Zinc finger, C3HC4 type (RING finger) domain-containing protein [Spironucleus salmonicida]|uniref:Zinc finger, C3HC4 type (RING finger) domain-containing protein n=1 Tax=Spironucleus salmonicida TaxID=348837 RepID=V6LUY8_9EUKA|nr:Zinc finger, C3HC4 type (RING finger) domain-containing protein [Spironucleus salmonicida]|eukprot:EST44619.1 Zinc finger, C3HC4 type (RING finger) domain-containing protein [Spironucleus salmonicida]
MNCKSCSNVLISPYQLPCGHSFCFTCIESLQNKQKFFHCPTCKKLVLSKPIENVDLQQLLQQKQKQSHDTSITSLVLCFNGTAITKQNTQFTVFLTKVHPKKQDFLNLSIQGKFQGEAQIKIKVQNQFVHEFSHIFQGTLLSIPFGPRSFLEGKFGKEWKIDIQLEQHIPKTSSEFVLDITNPKGFGDAIKAFKRQRELNRPQEALNEGQMLQNEELYSLKRHLKSQNAAHNLTRQMLKKAHSETCSYRQYARKLKFELGEHGLQQQKLGLYRQTIQQQKQTILKHNLIFDKLRGVLPHPQKVFKIQNADRSILLCEERIEIRPRFFDGVLATAAVDVKLENFKFLRVEKVQNRAFRRWENGTFDCNALVRNGLIREILVRAAAGASVSVCGRQIESEDE